MYGKMAQYYDRIYSFKDYAAETKKLIGWIESNCRSNGKRLLDVACGTGHHLEFLAKSFDAEGLDLSPELPDIPLCRYANVCPFRQIRCDHLPVQFDRLHDHD